MRVRVRAYARFGVQCDCARCLVEAAAEAEQPPPSTGDVDLTYVSLFVLKHTCPACMGTLAPEPPKGSRVDSGL